MVIRLVTAPVSQQPSKFFHRNMIAWHPLHKFVGTGAHGAEFAAVIVVGFLGFDGRCSLGQVLQEYGAGLFELIATV